MSLTLGRKASENKMNGALWSWVLEKAWTIDLKVLEKKEFGR